MSNQDNPQPEPKAAKSAQMKKLLPILLLSLSVAVFAQAAVPTTYPLGGSGTFTLAPVPSTVTQPAGNIPSWGTSCTCVTLTPAANGMSATFKILSTATVGQSVTISAVAPPYPDGTPGAAGQLTFTITASPYPTAYTITRTA